MPTAVWERCAPAIWLDALQTHVYRLSAKMLQTLNCLIILIHYLFSKMSET